MAVLVVLALPVSVWLLWPDPEIRAAVGQETTAPSDDASPSAASPAPSSPTPEDFGYLFGEASASAFAEEDVPEGIPDLGAIDVVGNLKHLRADRNFPCEGPTTGDRLITWQCATPDGRFAVEVVAEDPLTVLSVTATARGVPEGETEEFFGYVLELCLEDASALDPEAWVSGNVPSGGTTFAQDAEVSVYGSEEARALSLVSTGLSFD